MNPLQTIWTALDGWKMYLGAATILLSVVVEKGLGVDLPGIQIGDDWMNYIWSAWGLVGLKSALSK